MTDQDSIHALLPLYLIKLAGRQFRGRTRLQKLIFLVQKEVEGRLDYGFRPAQQGPLSYDLYRLMENMQSLSMIREVKEKTPSGHAVLCYELTSQGKAFLDFAMEKKQLSQEIKQAADKVYSSYGKLAFVDLLDKVHMEYPDYVA